MNVYRIRISILGRVQAVTVEADAHARTTTGEIEFRTAAGDLVAAFPTEIVVEIDEVAPTL